MRINLFKIYMLLMIDYYRPHGYELMKKIRSMSNDLIRTGPGTIYPLLFLLKSQKLVREVVEGRRKRYELTEKGREVLKQNLPKLWSLVESLRVIVLEELEKYDTLPPSPNDRSEDRESTSKDLEE